MNRVSILASLALVASLAGQNPPPDRLPVVEDVDVQPLVAATRRLVEALASAGAPLPKSDQQRLNKAMDASDAVAVRTIQEVLDRYCLLGVHINPESRVKLADGPAAKQLVQRDWRSFLVKVHNEAGVTASLAVTSPNAAPVYKRSTGSPEPKPGISKGDTRDRFLDIVVYRRPPMRPRLSGLELEYAIVQIASRDAGKREARFRCNVGQGTQDLGFRDEVSILFDCARAVEVELDVKDADGQPVMGAFEFRDQHGRVYPAPSRRLAPDFFFHPQVYRRTGEHVLLPPGQYTVRYGRGPEYRTKVKTIRVPDASKHVEKFELERWVNPAARGWWSGDHHIHAAGCAHYESPTQGVTPADMMRHVLGEDLNVGCVLSWGPCWYYQKQFFEGKTSELSTADHLMRYDVEVSGFPSSHCGHLTLLRLKEDDYPGTERIEDWPTFDLPILKWAKQQGGVVGFAHSGFGLQLPGRELPNYRVPQFNGIGANEYVVDVTHDAVDFISTVDTPATWELNIWYHTLNCGYRTRISGETDFPCIYGQKVGLGRSYVKLDGKLDYDAWVDGVRDGRCYVSDGSSHLMDFRINGFGVGRKRTGGGASELGSPRPRTFTSRQRSRACSTPNRAPHSRAGRCTRSRIGAWSALASPPHAGFRSSSSSTGRA